MLVWRNSSPCHRPPPVISLQVFRSRLWPTQPPKFGTGLSLPSTSDRSMQKTAVPQPVQVLRIRGFKLSLTAVVVRSSGFHRRLLGLINTVVHY